jgi:hypothetical protein
MEMDGLTLITNAIKIFLGSKNSLHSDQYASVKGSCSAPNSDVFSDDSSSYTSPREIKNIIKKLKKGKAPGGNGDPNILLKNIPRRATVFLTYIYNSCLKLCYFPKEWKHAVVIPIPKPGKDPSIRRTIAQSAFLALLVMLSRGSF